MKKIRIAIISLISAVVILIPAILPICVSVFTPTVYENYYVGALDKKIERLESIEEEKIVVIGGSSVAFGIDSALMERELGMPVVNFGLYAAIGTLAMMELAKPSIKSGDIVILSPELDVQTLSMYFSTEWTLKSLDGAYSNVLKFDNDLKMRLLGGSWRHAQGKLALMSEEISNPKGVYNANNFNEYGDIVWDRPENVMTEYYETEKANEIRIEKDVVAADFIDYVNDYVRYCRLRGAEVYYSYAPMNELAVVSTPDEIFEFEAFLADSLECEIIGFVDTYIMEAGYFYDTNYHLNNAGVTYRTRRLIEDITGTLMESGPDAPALPMQDVTFDGYDANERFFVYEQITSGSYRGAYKIVGLTEEGKARERLTVPLGAEGVKVISIGANAFADSAAKELVITANTNVRNLLDDFMSGSQITDIWIYYDFVSDKDKLSPPSDFGGGVTIHFPPGSIYSTHYDWNDSSGGYKPVEDAR